MSTRYGKLNNGRLVYAPRTLRDGDRYIVAPTHAEYVVLGWLPVVDTPPSEPAPEGYHWAPTGWKEEMLKIVRTYTAIENPPAPPRKFSKLKLYAILEGMGLWGALETWLKTQTVEGVNAFTAFSLAQDLSEDYPGWDQYLAAAKAALGVTDDKVELILEAALEG